MGNILITGSDGQLGRSLRKIADDYPEHNFIYTDLPDTDISDRRSVDNTICKSHTDVIVNCAAYTRVDAAETDIDKAYRANAEGAGVLGELASAYDIKLIHISTDYVFSGTNRNVPYTEDDKPDPLNIYGKSKLSGEQRIRESGCAAAIIRTSWLFSEFGNNFIKTMLDLSSREDTLRVVNDSYGSPTYATDLARAIMRIIAHGVKGFEIYHYCNRGYTSWYEFARTAFEMAGIKTKIYPISQADYKSPAERPEYTVLDTSKISNLGVAVPTWEESLSECLRALGIHVKNEYKK